MINSMNNINVINAVCLIVTYNPDEKFKYNVFQHLEIFERIIIVDNNSENSIFKEFLEANQDLSNLEIIQLEKNYGIAKALNIGIDFAISNNYQWLFSFDQDSLPYYNILSIYSAVLNTSNFKNVGIIGCEYTDFDFPYKFSKISYKLSPSIITSGSAYNLQIFSKVGYFNEALFIDGVDFDFNLRTMSCGYEVIKLNQPCIKHFIGAEKRKHFLFFSMKSSNHNQIRRYYMSRNHIYISLKYFYKYPFWVSKKTYFYLISIINLLMIESNKLTKIKAVIRGVFDGFKMFIYDYK